MTMAQEFQETERHFIERLRPHYEAKGYDFVPYPGPDRLPEFMGGYRPDAIALKGDHKIAIEVKNRKTPHADLSLKRIQQLFERHHDWQLRIMFVGGDTQAGISIPASTPEIVRRHLTEVTELIKHAQPRAAFLVGWSLLEAIARIVEPASDKRPYSPGTIIQTLAMNGYIDPEVEGKVRSLISMRNRIVHGDLETEPSKMELDLLLKVIVSILDRLRVSSS
ncbi:HepT-like ribonuclease domain-containing protein [Methylobacterium durans]|uniref:REase AHJR-like domain-containing protein n=1 Tax=Methylobacterium durans TaxID=2202825 RepID=A0A2U8W628_9HYPH|nr:HepT-like ribonuclease domain-containing protein [Methylobacterium durans]AWN41555.1 hypothetical protein DK389_14850 [Methylobacterium durans]